MRETVVMLHGFAGTHRAWDGVVARLDHERYLPLALDLPGHGAAADAPQPISFPACVEHVLAAAPERFMLCGYSLGGRIALHVALRAPARVSGLVLISSSAGIEDNTERAARREDDRELTRRLEHEPYKEFIESWNRRPLFAADPPEVARLMREDQYRNQADGLAAVMRGIGAGEMRPLWGHLGELRMPTMVLAGDRDAKFVAIAKRMVSALPAGALRVLPGGHRLLLENATAVADAVQQLALLGESE
jgi:2-succinyl-6-hydroxy-2,4-cyclohexadiene-1-carboxylate synthase